MTEEAAQELPSGRRRTVLLVEDDEMVRVVVSDILLHGGYHVLVARDGREAIEVAQAEAGIIDLLLADLEIPFVTGRRLAEPLLRARPAMKLLFMTGSVEDPPIAGDSILGRVPILQKPFSMNTLLAAVRAALR